MADVSKGSADRLKISGAIAAALVSHQGGIDAGLASEGSGLPRGIVLTTLFGWLGTTLERAEAALREADLAHMAELADDAEPRERRDATVLLLRAQMIDASDAVNGVYGASYAKTVGLQAPLSERPDMLVTQAANIVNLLGANTPPRVRLAGASLDVGALAAALDTKRGAAANALGDVAREEREKENTLSRRESATRKWARVYSGVASILAGLCYLAGLDDLAQRVRVTERRRAGIEDEPVTPPV